MKLTNKQKEQIKWVVWVVTILAMFTSWRVERAIYKTRLELTEEFQNEKINKIEKGNEKILDYTLQNKRAIDRITDILEYDHNNRSGETP